MQQQGKRSYAVIVICVILIVIAIFTRVRLLGIPFDRDEGEYAYAGQVILSGGMPYQDVYNMKFPGTYYFYAFIMAVFGQTVTAVHFSILLLNLASAFFIYKTGRLLHNANTGMIAAAIYAILSAGKEVQGVQANAEHFVVFFAMTAFFLLIKSIRSNKPKLLIASGALFGMAAMMKQHGALLAFSAFIILLLYGKKELKSKLAGAGAMALGLSLPFLIWCGWLVYSGTFDKFYFLAFQYAREYASYISLEAGWISCKGSFAALSEHSIVFWIFSAFGLLSFLFNKSVRAYFHLMLIFTVFSFLAVCPGFYFRPHYWLLLLPAVSLLAAVFFSTLTEIIRTRFSAFVSSAVFVVVFALAFVPYVGMNRGYFFTDSSSEVLFDLFGFAPFSYAKNVGEYLEKRTQPSDRIAMVASEPEVLFYAKRGSASGYMYIYPFLEENRYAGKMLSEWKTQIENSNPAYLVYSNYSGTWFGNERRREEMQNWYRSFTSRNYSRVAIFEITKENTLVITEGEEALTYQPPGEYWLAVYKRNT